MNKIERGTEPQFEDPPYILYSTVISFEYNNNKKDGYRQQNVRQRQKLISIIDYDVCILEYL